MLALYILLVTICIVYAYINTWHGWACAYSLSQLQRDPKVCHSHRITTIAGGRASVKQALPSPLADGTSLHKFEIRILGKNRRACGRTVCQTKLRICSTSQGACVCLGQYCTPQNTCKHPSLPHDPTNGSPQGRGVRGVGVITTQCQEQ
jgi:hypothetical protein